MHLLFSIFIFTVFLTNITAINPSDWPTTRDPISNRNYFGNTFRNEWTAHGTIAYSSDGHPGRGQSRTRTGIVPARIQANPNIYSNLEENGSNRNPNINPLSQYPGLPDTRPKTKSLSPHLKSNLGNVINNKKVLSLLKTGLLGGFAVRKIRQYNTRKYLSKYRRNYWMGERYYRKDNTHYYPNSRVTCVYRMDEHERDGLFYEDNQPIRNVVYQCQKYVDYCCGLDCCRVENGNSARINEAFGRIPSILTAIILVILIELNRYN